MKTTKRILVKACALVLAAASITAFLHLLGKGVAASGDKADTLTTAPDTAAYIVGQWDGRVALFTKDFENRPALETDIDIQNLREYDRQLLSAGITVDSYEDVLRLIEDFGP